MQGPRHLLWLPAGAAVSFGASSLFGDLLTLPVDLYYLVYFAIVLGFLGVYAARTGFDTKAWAARRVGWGLIAGVAGGLVLVRGVLARPATPGLSGAELWWALLWRGLVYGSVDGLLLLAFPWVVVRRALGTDRGGRAARARVGALAWVAVLFVTTAYHLGYRDFRSRKIVEPNVGSTIGALPTILTANPVASPISHVFLHVAAVLHAPGSPVFLPPHGAGPSSAGDAAPVRAPGR